MKRLARFIAPMLLLTLPIALHAEPQKETKKQRPYKQYAIEQFIAVLNPPQVAILAVGSIEDRPRASDGDVVVAPTMTMTSA